MAARFRREAGPDMLDNARVVMTGRQKSVAAGVIVIAAIWLLAAPMTMLSTTLLVIMAIYLASSLARLWIVLHGLSVRPAPDDPAHRLDDASLPAYTVLVPAYREASQIPNIIQAMSAIDYPRDKLEILLLLEEDDVGTLAAVDANPLPWFITAVTFPDVGPRGKPRACNVGLAHAHGELLVIFDAEDVPEPDQLRKAAAAFQRGGRRLACAQARLDFYNGAENLMTRWFTAEYATWFGLYLPGLQRTRLPIPLGGTSNHLRVSMLRELGGWDAWNVTEDADLGVRIARAGYETVIIDSVTWEEANSQIGNWIRQRSRWIKGHLVTWLVHMRHPGRLMRAVGMRGVLGILLTLAISGATSLFNPLLWALTVMSFVATPNPIQPLLETSAVQVGNTCLLVGSALHVVITMLGCWRRGHPTMIPFVLLIPIYWVLMSLAAWKGGWQLLRGRAAFWEKTDHGLSSWSPSVVTTARDTPLQPAAPAAPAAPARVGQPISMCGVDAADTHGTGSGTT